MSRAAARRLGIAALAVLAGCAQAGRAPGGGADDGRLDLVERADAIGNLAGPAADAPPTARLALTPVVLRGAGWTPAEVRAALAGAASLYRRDCGVRLEARTLLEVGAPARYAVLDGSEEAALAGRVSASPAIFFVGRSEGGHAAFAYLPGAPVPQAGTAWITRDAAPGCRAWLVAHEIWHLAARSARHAGRADSVTHAECRTSNVEGAAPRPRFTPAECAALGPSSLAGAARDGEPAR